LRTPIRKENGGRSTGESEAVRDWGDERGKGCPKFQRMIEAKLFGRTSCTLDWRKIAKGGKRFGESKKGCV